MRILNFLLTLLSLLISVSAAHADLMETVEFTPAVIDHIKEVQNQTIEMASVVEEWSGDIIEALKVMIASTALIKAIEDGTETATNLPEDMNTSQCIKVKKATKELLEHIESSLATIIRSKLKFDHAGLTSTMISKIEETKEEAEKLIAAIVDKLSVGKGIGRRLGKKISAAFDSAIADFSKEPGELKAGNNTR